MVRLKADNKEIALNQGVLHNMLFSCTQMRAGKHHLYDESLFKGADGSNSPLADKTSAVPNSDKYQMKNEYDDDDLNFN